MMSARSSGLSVRLYTCIVRAMTGKIIRRHCNESQGETLFTNACAYASDVLRAGADLDAAAGFLRALHPP